MELARRRGELCEAKEVKLAFSTFLEALMRGLDAVPDQVGRERNLSPEIVSALSEAVRAIRNELVDRAEHALLQVEGSRERST